MTFIIGFVGGFCLTSAIIVLCKGELKVYSHETEQTIHWQMKPIDDIMNDYAGRIKVLLQDAAASQKPDEPEELPDVIDQMLIDAGVIQNQTPNLSAKHLLGLSKEERKAIETFMKRGVIGRDSGDQ